MSAPSVIVHRRLHRRSVFAQTGTPVGVFFFTLVLYLATLTQVHTFDALSYITSVEHKPWTEIFHPHHLAYGPLGELALWFSQVLGYAGGAALPMQFVNAVAGALGVAYFFAITRRISRRSDVALIAAMLLGSAYAYWYYAVEVEVYTVAALFLLICLDLLLRFLAHSSWQLAALLGLAQGGAVLFHQTNVLLCVPILLCAMYDVISSEQRRAQQMIVIRRWLLYAAVFALTVGLPYLFVGVVSGFRSINEFTAWLTEYARTGWWGGPITPRKWAELGTGLAETLAQPGGALLWLLLVGLLVLHGRGVLRARRILVALLVTWLLVYGAFFLWWEPDNVEFWIASLPPALLLLALALQHAPHWRASIWIALAVAMTVFGLNYDSIRQRGDAATDLQRLVARELAAQSTPADLLLIPDGLQELYLPYYEKRENFLSLNQALFDNGDDWEQACNAVQARIEAARHAGATTLIADEVLHPPELLLQRHRLAQPQVAACFTPYQPELLPLTMPPAAPPYWRLPRAQELAAGAGWHFERSPQGWLAGNINASRFAVGWQFEPGIDSSFTSPLLNFDAGHYRAIEIRLVNSTHAHDAQLFYAGPDGKIDERHSVRWTLEPTTEPTTYHIDLANTPGWQGTITRLRLDPVGVGDGGAMVLEKVRIEK